MARPTVGNYIKRIRAEQGYNVASAAREMGRSRARYHDIETGAAQPSVEFMKDFMKTFELTSDEKSELVRRAAREVKTTRLDMSTVNRQTRQCILVMLTGKKLTDLQLTQITGALSIC